MHVRGRKYLMTFDTAGYVNYFSSTNFRSFNFRARYEIGGSPLATIDGEPNENVVTGITDYGSFGFFV